MGYYPSVLKHLDTTRIGLACSDIAKPAGFQYSPYKSIADDFASFSKPLCERDLFVPLW